MRILLQRVASNSKVYIRLFAVDFDRYSCNYPCGLLYFTFLSLAPVAGRFLPSSKLTRIDSIYSARHLIKKWHAIAVLSALINILPFTRHYLIFSPFDFDLTQRSITSGNSISHLRDVLVTPIHKTSKFTADPRIWFSHWSLVLAKVRKFVPAKSDENSRNDLICIQR